MSTVDVESAVRQHINAETTWVEGTNLFSGPVRPVREGVPVNAVFVLSTGGAQPEPYIGDPREVFEHAVQIRVRYADSDNYSTGAAAARSLRDVMQSAGTISGLFDVRVINSSPTYLGLDDDSNAHEWSINLLVTEIAEP